VLQAGGFPLELPALSLSELVKMTTMLCRMLAMDVRTAAQPSIDGAIADGRLTTDHARPGALGAQRQCLYLHARRPDAARQRQGARCWVRDTWKWDERRAGKINKAQWLEVEGGIARSHCMTMGAASTMTGIAGRWA
jgi:dihydroxy-acid dehydratase